MEVYKNEVETLERINVDFKQISLNIRRCNYKFLGSGSGRIVFDLDNGNVVKVAKNNKGIAQNEAEYKIALEDDTGLFAKVLQVSEKYTFLIMEKAKKIRSISYVWEYFHVRSNQELYRIRELQDIAQKYNLELRDFGRVVNWGQIHGKPVIIDYGFTQQVRRRFYTSLAYRLFNKRCAVLNTK